MSLYDEVVPEIVRRQFLKARSAEEAVDVAQCTSTLCELHACVVCVSCLHCALEECVVLWQRLRTAPLLQLARRCPMSLAKGKRKTWSRVHSKPPLTLL